MLKRHLEQRNQELRKEVDDLKVKINAIKKIPCGHRLITCPNCGNYLLINDGAYAERLNHTFYCAVGHSFTFSS